MIETQNGHAIQVRTLAAPFDFTPEQRKMIRDSYLNGATEEEAAVLLELARLRRLNPIAQQIHFVKRWNSQRRCETWAAQVGIDGFRSMAEETKLYDGQDEPEFEYDAKGFLKIARVRVYRKDVSRAFVGRADFSEYVQLTKEQKPTHMWSNKPHIMLAKCAEALAMRKAFPQQLSGLYAPEEMDHEERELNPAPAAEVPALSKTDRVKAKLKAKVQLVDVKPGETEEQAKARLAAPAPAPTPWERGKAMLMAAGIVQFNAYARQITGKSSGADVTEDDLLKLEASLSEREQEAF